jgi:hypothetical protein
MKRFLLTCSITFVTIASATAIVAAEVRIWTDSTGKHKTEAEFVSLDDGIVTLRKPGTDRTVKLPLERLSDEDQNYVDDLVRELERAADETPQPAARPRATSSDAAQATAPVPRNAGPRRPANNVINSVRGAAFRAQTMNNMKQIALALVQYETSRNRFPAAAIMTPDGKPGLSWRVAILPMIEESGLYRQFNLDEPWDSEHNKALIAYMPALFQSPGSDLDEGYTNYLAVVSPDSIIVPGPRGMRSRDVVDGLSRTAMIVEADDTYAAIWTKPDDYDWDRTSPAYGLGGIWSGTFFVGFGDGSIERLDAGMSPDQLNAYFTRNGGEVITD